MATCSDAEYIENMAHRDMTPIFRIDLNARDYMCYDKVDHFFVLDTVSSNSKAYSITRDLIEYRSAPVFIAFYRRPPFYSFDQTAVYLAQNGNTLAHSAVWFGDSIAEMFVSDSFGIAFKTLPPQSDLTWEMIQLAFNGTEAVVKAFEIANDIVTQSSKEYIGYGYRALRVIEASLLRLIGRHDCDYDEDDFDYQKPATWIGGVHCTQLVLLFLKRCVAEGLITIECDKKRECFMNLNSHVCLPCDLMELLQDIWGPDLPRVTKEF